MRIHSLLLCTSVLALGSVVAAAGCRSMLLVALPSNDAEWLSDFVARATDDAHEVSIEARLHAWQGEPRDLPDRATPVLVRIENRGRSPIEISPSAFEFVSGTSSFRTLPPERLVNPPGRLVTEELREGMVAPGETRSGFLYFPRLEGWRGFMRLRALLFDESRALLGSLDVPFSSGYMLRCSLGYVDEREPAQPTNILFHTCLAPF